jgi:hypothetical protein
MSSGCTVAVCNLYHRRHPLQRLVSAPLALSPRGSRLSCADCGWCGLHGLARAEGCAWLSEAGWISGCLLEAQRCPEPGLTVGVEETPDGRLCCVIVDLGRTQHPPERGFCLVLAGMLRKLPGRRPRDATTGRNGVDHGGVTRPASSLLCQSRVYRN